MTKPQSAMVALETHRARKAAGLPALERTYVMLGHEVPASFARFCQDCQFYDAPGMATGHCTHGRHDEARKAHKDFRVIRPDRTLAKSTCDHWEPVA